MIDPSAPRIVSLLPSATEICACLGLADHIVGVSHECDAPVEIIGRPICTATRIDPTASSKTIDDQVKSALTDALSLYDVKTDVLRNLQPDIIVTQDQCEVCAVSLEDVEAACAALSGTPARIVSLNPQSLEDMLQDIERIATAAGRAEIGLEVAGDLRDRARMIASAATSVSTTRPKVACIEWTEPLMAAGNWVPELVDMAGGIDPFGTPGAHAPWISVDDLMQAQPDIVVFMPCGYDLDRTTAEARLFMAAIPAFQDLPAARSGRVYATNGNAYFNRPGPRLVDSLAILATIIQTSTAPFPADCRVMPLC